MHVHRGIWPSPVTQQVKSPPAMRKTLGTLAGFLDREDPLEEEMATHTNSFVWKIPWTEGPGGLQYMGSRRIGND